MPDARGQILCLRTPLKTTLCPAGARIVPNSPSINPEPRMPVRMTLSIWIYFSEAMSITKRYFTSLLSMRS